MLRLLGGMTTLVMSFLGFGTAAVEAQPVGEIGLLNALPGMLVNASVDGAEIVAGSEFGVVSDIGTWSGEFMEVEVRAPEGTPSPIALGEFEVPVVGNWTVVVHLDASGGPTVTTFDDDLPPTQDGHGRVTIRHCAEMPAVDIRRDGTPLIGSLRNSMSAPFTAEAGTIDDLELALVDEPPIVDLPRIELDVGSEVVIYLTGSLDGESFDFIEMPPRSVEAIEDVPVPGRVDTGYPISTYLVSPVLLSVGFFVLAGLLMMVRVRLGRR